VDNPQRIAAERKWSERQDSNLSPAIDLQALTKTDAQRDAQKSGALGHDLSRVVTAWSKLSPPLKAAILAIVGSISSSTEVEP
jgi:hypothetical protein